MQFPSLRTQRLLLRPWRDADREPFALLNSDPVVMQHYPAPLSRAESDATVDRILDHFTRHRFGMWAVEIPGVSDFVGFVGIMVPTWSAHFTPCVEIGWRLAHAHWGQGYATEAAVRCLQFGFDDLRLDEIVALTTPGNMRSRAVMERLGMTRNPADDFDHPRVPADHPLCRHVLYRLPRAAFRAGQ